MDTNGSAAYSFLKFRSLPVRIVSQSDTGGVNTLRCQISPSRTQVPIRGSALPSVVHFPQQNISLSVFQTFSLFFSLFLVLVPMSGLRLLC